MATVSDPLSEIIELGTFLLTKTGTRSGSIADRLSSELKMPPQGSEFLAALSFISARIENIIEIIDRSENFKDTQKAALLNILNQMKSAFSIQYIANDYNHTIPQLFKASDFAFLDLASNSIRPLHQINIPDESEINEMLEKLDDAIASLNESKEIHF